MFVLNQIVFFIDSNYKINVFACQGKRNIICQQNHTKRPIRYSKSQEKRRIQTLKLEQEIPQLKPEVEIRCTGMVCLSLSTNSTWRSIYHKVQQDYLKMSKMINTIGEVC